YALYKVEMGNDVFPRGLLVEDVVTVGAPHHQPENAEGELCAGAPFADVQQVCGLTGMMRVLRYLGQSPQGASGTDWTVAASLCDDYLPDSFWWQYGRFAAWFYTGWRPELWDDMINMTGAHKVLYVSPCYYHDQYYQSDFEPEPGYPGGRVLVNDADVWFGSGSGWVHEAGTAGRFPIWTWNALASPSW
ncbi:MAG TPA: hypothetical protein VI997_10870, partial [Candidatus Thermoplasmatota archaeon]|nr:hypothetical protein [Candidatus Thermoplasmatota archaeon]